MWPSYMSLIIPECFPSIRVMNHVCFSTSDNQMTFGEIWRWSGVGWDQGYLEKVT